MRLSRAVSPSLLLALLLPSCSGDYPNPFASDNAMTPPPAAADIIYASNVWSTRPGSPHEIYAIEDTGAGVTRLTFCNQDSRRCHTMEAAPAPDRKRVAVRRVATDTNADNRLTGDDGEALLMLDLARGVEGGLVQANARVTGVDWFPNQELLFYSASGAGTEDLYQISTNGQQNQDLTGTPTSRERRPRLNPAATAVVFERLEGSGRGAIWLATSTGTRAVTTSGTGSGALPLTHYQVGADADPSFSPDGQRIAFRRLTAPGNGDLGSWDILTVAATGAAGTGLATVVSGGIVHRGGPDWGRGGIVFTETTAGGPTQLVVINPDGTGRRVIMTVGAGFDIANPRWLP